MKVQPLGSFFTLHHHPVIVALLIIARGDTLGKRGFSPSSSITVLMTSGLLIGVTFWCYMPYGLRVSCYSLILLQGMMLYGSGEESFLLLYPSHLIFPSGTSDMSLPWNMGQAKKLEEKIQRTGKGERRPWGLWDRWGWIEMSKRMRTSQRSLRSMWVLESVARMWRLNCKQLLDVDFPTDQHIFLQTDNSNWMWLMKM